MIKQTNKQKRLQDKHFNNLMQSFSGRIAYDNLMFLFGEIHRRKEELTKIINDPELDFEEGAKRVEALIKEMNDVNE